MFLLEKALAAFLTPLGTALLLGGVALIAGWRGWRKAALALGVTATLWLYLWSTPWLSYSFRRMIESEHPARPIAEMSQAPVVVVLGGGVATAQPPLRFQPDLGNAADRVWHAARL